MGKYIPVEPEKWGEMVKAMAEVTRLKAEVERLNYKLGRLLGAEREWVLVEPEEYQRLKAKEGNQS